MTGHFEAKKHAYRQTQDGVVISFVIHPNDVAPDLATAALGTRYMLGFAEIGDDDQPKRDIPSEAQAVLDQKLLPGEVERLTPKDRKPFALLPLSQQAALRCNDTEFRTFVAQLDGEGMFLMYDTDMAADYVRGRCGVSSRAELNTSKDAARHWGILESNFQAWRTDRQYADARR